MLICGIIDELEASGLVNPGRPFLLSYFFCQATNSGLNNYTAVLRGLIYMLVTQQSSLLSHLDGKQEYIAAHWNYKVVIEEVFCDILADPGLQETYFVVDALDECVDELSAFLDMITRTCSRARWIVSSRNRCEIQQHMGDQPLKTAISLELNAESVSQAVDHFTSYRIRRLIEKKRIQNDMADQVRYQLSKNSEGTFLWVSLACQRLEKCRPWEIRNELLQFPSGLTKLYRRMLAQIRSDLSSDLYVRLLATASTVFRPLTFAELIAMEELDLDEKMLPDVVAECGSFLTAKENTVFFIHQSAKDFLINESSPVLFRSGLAQHHCALFQRSITILQALHKDLYGLVRIGVTVKEGIHRRPEPDPLRSLKYACISWADHLQMACKLEMHKRLHRESPLIRPAISFIEDKFLFWLEALSLCQKTSVAAKALLFLKNLPTACPQLESEDLIEDALRFFRHFRYIIDRFPLQIYVSGLLFSPQNSLVRHLFEYCAPKIFTKVPEVDKNWDAVQTRYDHPCSRRHNTTKFLADTQHLLTCSRDSGLTIWQVEDGTINRTLQTHDFGCATVSSDLEWLAVITLPSTSNCEPSVLQVRDFSSNKVLWNKELADHYVNGMEISPDNRWLALYYRTTVELYDLNLIKLEVLTAEPSFALGHQEMHEIKHRISFSSDGALMALNANCTFDIQNNHWYEKTPSWKGWFCEARFIPGTHILASCSNDTDIVYLWHVFKGVCEERILPHRAISLEFAHFDTWAVVHGAKRLSLDIIVSHDDKTIVTLGDDGVLVLDVHAILTRRSSLTPSGIIRYDMSDDWRLSAHHLSDRLEIWDNITATKISELKLNDTSIMRLTFSASGRDLAFNYCKPHCLLISVWTLSNNTLRNFSGHQFRCTGLAISENTGSGGHWLAAKSDKMVSVWDITTGKHRTFIDISAFMHIDISRITFAGSRLGVLHSHPEHASSSEYHFYLFDIRTREQLYRVSFPTLAWSTPFPTLRLSSNGGSGMVYIDKGPRNERCLCIWDSEGNIRPATSDRLEAEHFSFQDGKTIYTQRGCFPINSIPIGGENPIGCSNRVSWEHTQATRCFDGVHLGYNGYGYIDGEDWITLDNAPLLWLPIQYRPCTVGCIACGDNYVIVRNSSGVYSIGLKENARDFI